MLGTLNTLWQLHAPSPLGIYKLCVHFTWFTVLQILLCIISQKFSKEFKVCRRPIFKDFCDLIFMNECSRTALPTKQHANASYNGLGVRRLTVNTTKIRSLVNFKLYIRKPIFCSLISNVLLLLFSPFSYAPTVYHSMAAHSGNWTFLLCLWLRWHSTVLRRIWKLPFNSHTRIVYCTARLDSIF